MAQCANAASAHIRGAFPDRSHTHIHTTRIYTYTYNTRTRSYSRAYNRTHSGESEIYARTPRRGLLRFSGPAGQMFHLRSVNNAARVVRGAAKSRRYNANRGFPGSDHRAPGFIDPTLGTSSTQFRRRPQPRNLAEILRVMRQHPWTLISLRKRKMQY